MGVPLPQLNHLGVFKQDQPDAIFAKASALIHELDSGDGVLVLSDMYGATPCNVSTRLSASRQSGVYRRCKLTYVGACFDLSPLAFDGGSSKSAQRWAAGCGSCQFGF